MTSQQIASTHLSQSIWDRVDVEVAKSIRQKSPESSGEPGVDVEVPRWQQRNWKRFFRIGDGFGVAAWSYLIVKTLIFDIERALIRLTVPSLEFLADFRFFAILALGAVLVLVFRQTSLLLFGYIALFPLVVTFWKIPRFFYRRKSWNLALASLNAIQALFRRFKFNFPARVIEILAMLVILLSGGQILLLVASSWLALALLVRYCRAIFSAVRASQFLLTQETMVARISDAAVTGRAYRLSDTLRADEIQKFNSGELQNFANTISTGLLLLRGLGYYATLLAKYRRSNAGLVIAAASFIWLLAQSVVFLTLINFGAWRALPSEYILSSSASGSLFEFLYFTVTALYGTVIPQIGASGPVALTIAVSTGLYGPILVVALALQLFFGIRQSRDDQKFEETILVIRAAEDDLERRLEEEYEVSPDEALRRLQALGIGTALFLTAAASRASKDDESE